MPYHLLRQHGTYRISSLHFFKSRRFKFNSKVNHRLCTPGVRRENEPPVISRQLRNIEIEKQRITYDKVEKGTRAKELREGKKYGRNFVQYRTEEVKEIIDTDFIYEMYFALHPYIQTN